MILFIVILFQDLTLTADLGKSGSYDHCPDQAFPCQINPLGKDPSKDTESYQGTFPFLKSLQKSFPFLFCHIRCLTHAAHPVYGKFFLINLQYVFHKTIRRKKHHIISLPLPDTSGNISGDLPVFCTISPGIPAAYVAADKNPAVFFWERRLHINPIGITVCCQKLPVIEHGKHCS